MNGHLVGALYGSADIEYASLFANAGRRRLGRLILRRVFVVHQIAVAPGQRRAGIGRKLLAGALQAATTGGAWVTVLSFDSAHDALPSFYEAVGLTVLEPGQILGVKFRGVFRMIGMSLDTPRDAWAFVVLDGARARARALRRHLSP
ncbi:GNAT family N-acetyltransferase [Microbacterium sp. NPDC055665]